MVIMLINSLIVRTHDDSHIDAYDSYDNTILEIKWAYIQKKYCKHYHTNAKMVCHHSCY